MKTLQHIMEDRKDLIKFNKKVQDAVIKEMENSNDLVGFLSFIMRPSQTISCITGTKQSLTKIVKRILSDNPELIPVFEEAISLAKGINYNSQTTG
jgi:hypothetical protein